MSTMWKYFLWKQKQQTFTQNQQDTPNIRGTYIEERGIGKYDTHKTNKVERSIEKTN